LAKRLGEEWIIFEIYYILEYFIYNLNNIMNILILGLVEYSKIINSEWFSSQDTEQVASKKPKALQFKHCNTP